MIPALGKRKREAFLTGKFTSTKKLKPLQKNFEDEEKELDEAEMKERGITEITDKEKDTAEPSAVRVRPRGRVPDTSFKTCRGKCLICNR